MRRNGGATAVLFVILATTWLAAPAGADPVIIEEFSWGNIQNHPSGIPDGNYLTPNKDQVLDCLSGCVLYATVGAMEIQFKIQHANPALTMDFSEESFLDQFGVHRAGGGGYVCGGDCGLDENFTVPDEYCIANELETHPVSRRGFINPTVTYTLEWDGIGPGSLNWDNLRNRIREGPVVAHICVNHADTEIEALQCTPEHCYVGSTESTMHAVVLVGYRVTEINPDDPPLIEFQTKNSWGRNAYNYSEYLWVPWNSGCFVTDYFWWRVTSVDASDTTVDTDADGIPDYLDLCLYVPDPSGTADGSGQRNFDNDYLGDACDDDVDGDGIADDYDIHPHNRYLAYDLDGDGIPDDPGRAIDAAGDPDPAQLYTEPLKDYYDPYTMSHNDGDIDLHREQVCINECDRIQAMDPARRLPGFFLGTCRYLCDSQLLPRDNCSPLSSPNYDEDVWSVCRDLRGQLLSHDVMLIGMTAPRCASWFYNPGPGQSDRDLDGVGDFCDEEPLVLGFRAEVGSHPWQSSNYLGIQLNMYRCYDEQYRVHYQTWGGRGQGGAAVFYPHNAALEACYCPADPWDQQLCGTYCPADAEFPTANDPERNPGASNRAWDPISSPDDCMDKIGMTQGLDYHLCQDLFLRFRSQWYTDSPPRPTSWRWKTFYDADRTDDLGNLVLHPSIAYSASDPGLVKLRLAWPPEGEDPSADQKAFTAATRMMGGCVLMEPDLDRDLRLEPAWVLPPSALHVMIPWIPPNDLVSGFADVALPGAALGLFGEHVMAFSPDGSALLGASPVAASDPEKFAGAGGAAFAAVGFLDAALASDILQMPVIAPTKATPVVYHLRDGVLWLGLLAHGNRWLTWEEAFGVPPPALDETLGLVADPAAGWPLLLGSKDGAVVLYAWNGDGWSEERVFVPAEIDEGVKGVRFLSGPAGRHIYLVGGAGPGWGALLHRYDRISGRIKSLQLPEEVEGIFADARMNPGAWLTREGELYLVGPRVVRVNLHSLGAEVLPAGLEEGVGGAYVWFDEATGELVVIPAGGEGFGSSVLRLDPDDPRGDWIGRPWLGATEAESTGEDGGQQSRGTLGGGGTAMVVLEVTADNAGRAHRARLLDPLGLLALRLLDETGATLDEDATSAATKEIVFTPQAEANHYVAQALPAGPFDPGTFASYELSVQALTGSEENACEDSGCGCGTGTDDGWTLLLALALLLRRRTTL